MLHPDVCDGDTTGVLAVHSLSKVSNLAGYRAGFVAGDPALVSGLLEVRKHAGMIVPRPVQAALEAAVSDDAHVAERLNPNGGAIALGHPLGGSGARIMTTLVHHMRDNGIRYGLQTMCEGGGQANATILELL